MQNVRHKICESGSVQSASNNGTDDNNDSHDCNHDYDDDDGNDDDEDNDAFYKLLGGLKKQCDMNLRLLQISNRF